jgi:membrane protein required for colicin V production
MNSLDVIILIIIAFNALLGIMRGAIWQILRIGSIILGIVVARQFGNDVLARMPGNLRDSSYAIIVVQVALFLAVYLVMFGVTNLVKAVVNKIKLGGVDKAAGAVVGAAKGAALCCIVLYLQYIPMVTEVPTVKDQLYGNPAKNIAPSKCNDVFISRVKPWLDQKLPHELTDRVTKLRDEITKR